MHIKNIFPDNSPVFTLPLHKLIFHLPEQSRRYPFHELSTEDFEALWKFLRNISKNHCNHKGDDCKDFYKRMYFKEQLENDYTMDNHDNATSEHSVDK